MERGVELYDWSDPKLLSAFEADAFNGFGFQCDSKQTRVPKRMYIGKVFLVEPDTSLGYPRYDMEVNVVQNQILNVLSKNDVSGLFTKETIWFTDYLGREFLTIDTRLYPFIPQIINAILSIGTYTFVTHTVHSLLQARFVPGQVFTRQAWELHVLENVMKTFDDFMTIPTMKHNPDPPTTEREGWTEREVWERLRSFGGFRPLLKHWNFATEEGRALCSRVRLALGKTEYSKMKHGPPRMWWKDYAEITAKYNVLHAGNGWGAYEPIFDNKQIPLGMASEPDVKKQKSEDEEDLDSTCMICLDAKATTLVLPCNHTVVCDNCSKLLRTTGDNKTCVRCRRAITHVAYEQDNEMEEK